MTEFSTTGRDRNRHLFYYRYENNGKHLFRIFISPNPAQGSEFFEFYLVDFGNQLRVVMMAHNDQPEFIAQGIPEAIIIESGKLLGKQVVSSSNKHQDTEKFRTDAASKVWERLVSVNLADYDSNEDRYFANSNHLYPINKKKAI